MEIKTIKIKKTNEFTYTVKDGRKTVEKIIKLSNGWSVCCREFNTIEEAKSYLKSYLENTYNAFEDKYTIELMEV